MAIRTLDINEFLLRAGGHPILDVRSPGEYHHAHLPGAISFPLFTDEERKVVGTAYKKVSREEAIKIGLEYFGPKMRIMVEQVETILSSSENRTVFVHCWRGGMRSGAIAWLLDLYGFEVYLLQGGYKAFRKWVLAQFEKKLPMIVVGGYTGSGKTAILHSLKNKGELIIDLEEIAGHRGSAFGNLGLPPQPGVEQVENQLAFQIHSLHATMLKSGKKWIWVEDESRRIGNINLPEAFYQQLKNSTFIFLNVSFAERLNTILNNYGAFSLDKLENAILRIRKRMGDELNRKALQLLQDNDLKGCFEVLLKYYDRYYLKSSFSHERTTIHWDVQEFNPDIIANNLIETINTKQEIDGN